MIVMTCHNLRKHYGPEPVLNGVTFDLRAGERVSLVGPNGAGKTTLLNILSGREEADAGEVSLTTGVRLGLLEQQPKFDEIRTVWEEARHGLAELLQLAKEAEEAAHALSSASDTSDRRRLSERYDRLQQELHRRDAYHVDHRVERVLEGLGFAPDSFDQPVTQLSGGQQNRLLLAKLLLGEPDILLLDEPSNHLDIAATEWLEDYLVQSRQAVLVVSHDRYFLDRVTQRTLELFRGTVDSFPGNFSAYKRQKDERLEVQRRTYDKQQIEIAKMEDFIRRYHYGERHAQAEDRRKKLERIERVEPPREIAMPPMGFPAASRTGDIVLRVEGLAKSYQRSLFSQLTFDVLRGEKWGILGPNGSGKTTLLRCLVGEVAPDAGRVQIGTGVKLGYFDQKLDFPNDEVLVVDAVRPAHKEFIEQQRRDLLARFGVIGDMVFQSVGSLSGGERNRVALARLSASDANTLLLDEPTNHLDLWARGALEQALKQYDGTVICVSHDRYFLNQVVDHLLVVEPDRFRVILGNYDTYVHLSRQSVVPTPPSPEKVKPTGDSKGAGDSTSKPERRKRRFPYRKVADLEQEIQQREQRITEIHECLTLPDVLRDGDRVKQYKQELADLQVKLEQLYEHWTEAVELN